MRMKLLTHKYFWLELWWGIRDWFNPRQKWLTKLIPNGWCDKVELIKVINFEMLVHFVDGEKAFETIEWEATPEHKEAWDKIMGCYKAIKEDLPLLYKEYDDYLDANYSGDLDNMFGDRRVDENGLVFYQYTPEQQETASKRVQIGNEIQTRIDELEQKTLHTIIEVRNYL